MLNIQYFIHFHALVAFIVSWGIPTFPLYFTRRYKIRTSYSLTILHCETIYVLIKIQFGFTWSFFRCSCHYVLSIIFLSMCFYMIRQEKYAIVFSTTIVLEILPQCLPIFKSVSHGKQRIPHISCLIVNYYGRVGLSMV